MKCFHPALHSLLHPVHKTSASSFFSYPYVQDPEPAFHGTPTVTYNNYEYFSDTYFRIKVVISFMIFVNTLISTFIGNDMWPSCFFMYLAWTIQLKYLWSKTELVFIFAFGPKKLIHINEENPPSIFSKSLQTICISMQFFFFKNTINRSIFH